MTKSKARLMGMTDVKTFVRRWFDERVEIETGAVMKTTDGWGNFIEWLNDQNRCLDLIYAYQWGRAMEQKRFRFEKDGNDWCFHGIKLKRPAKEGGVKQHETRGLLTRWIDERVEIDSDAVTRNTEAFRSFLEWVGTQGELLDSPLPLHFDLAIKDTGFEQDRDINGWYIIRGIKLKDD